MTIRKLLLSFFIGISILIISINTGILTFLTNRYFSDADFNSFPVTDYNYFSYKFNQTTKEDVTKFFNIVIEDLERVVKFA